MDQFRHIWMETRYFVGDRYAYIPSVHLNRMTHGYVDWQYQTNTYRGT